MKAILGSWGQGSRAVGLIVPVKKSGSDEYGGTDVLVASAYGLLPLDVSPSGIALDYVPFLLYDQVVVESNALDLTIHEIKNREFKVRIPRFWAEVLETLVRDGAIVVKTAEELLGLPRTQMVDTLTEMVQMDLGDTGLGIYLNQSSELWKRFVQRWERMALRSESWGLDLHSRPDGSLGGLVDINQLPGSFNAAVLRTLDMGAGLIQSKEYIPILYDINFTLIASWKTGLPFHDWLDYEPIYQYKLTRAGHLNRNENKQAEATKRLFELYLPDWQFDSPSAFLRLREDKRLRYLREFVSTVEKPEEINKDFLIQALRHSLELERRANHYKKIMSLATIPLSLIPTIGELVSIVVDQTAEYVIDQQVKKDFNWHYFLEDKSRRYTKDQVEEFAGKQG